MSNKPDKSSFLRAESELVLDLVSGIVHGVVDSQPNPNIQRLDKRKKRKSLTSVHQSSLKDKLWICLFGETYYGSPKILDLSSLST